MIGDDRERSTVCQKKLFPRKKKWREELFEEVKMYKVKIRQNYRKWVLQKS